MLDEWGQFFFNLKPMYIYNTLELLCILQIAKMR